jgi:hypothetical protein
MVKLATRSSDDLRTLAEAKFNKKELQLREGAKAMKDYLAQGVAEREKTARLRGLREAKEATEAAKRELATVETKGKAAGIRKNPTK